MCSQLYLPPYADGMGWKTKQKSDSSAFFVFCFCQFCPQFDSVSFYIIQANQLQHCYNDIPIFHNLTRLELYGIWQALPQVLQQCPKLQHLELYQVC